MNKTLFVGDSHSKGFRIDSGSEIHWSDNNYAELYGEINNEPVIIYAQESAGNYAYAEWIKNSLVLYPDINQIFIQNTYWNRYNIAASSRIDHGVKYKLGHFAEEVMQSTEKCRKYTDLSIKDDFIELKLQPDPNSYNLFTGYKIDFAEEQDLREIQHYDFDFTYLFYILMSQLQYKQFTKDLIVIDQICKEHNIPWYLWRMNNRVVLPDDIEPWANIQNGTVIYTSAADWFYNEDNLDFEDYKIDDEHYSKFIHEKIAEKFIPYMLDHRIS